jgi:hypothetical protein
LILALARDTLATVPRDFPGEPGPSETVTLPTAYNHLEGALALTQHIPVLIFYEQSMDRTGIFNSGIRPTGIPAGADAKWARSNAFLSSVDAWAAAVDERRDVFLGYCSKANRLARAIRGYLEKSGYSVLDWARDFKPAGSTILDEIERAASRCRCAVFLFTQDDELDKQARGKATFTAVPRDNVLLEAGYFTHARGKDRVAIVREKDAKMPADLGGIIYLSLDGPKGLAAVKSGLSTFLAQAI